MDFICNNIIKSELAVYKDKISTDTPGVPPDAIDIFTKIDDDFLSLDWKNAGAKARVERQRRLSSIHRR